MSTSPRLLKTRSRAADDATADCSATMKSMKPSERPADDEPKAFHHVTGLLARPLAVNEGSWKRGCFCLENNGCCEESFIFTD